VSGTSSLYPWVSVWLAVRPRMSEKGHAFLWRKRQASFEGRREAGSGKRFAPLSNLELVPRGTAAGKFEVQSSRFEIEVETSEELFRFAQAQGSLWQEGGSDEQGFRIGTPRGSRRTRSKELSSLNGLEVETDKKSYSEP